MGHLAVGCGVELRDVDGQKISARPLDATAINFLSARDKYKVTLHLFRETGFRCEKIVFSTKSALLSTEPACLSTQPTGRRVDRPGSPDLPCDCRRGGKPTLQGKSGPSRRWIESRSTSVKRHEDPGRDLRETDQRQGREIRPVGEETAQAGPQPAKIRTLRGKYQIRGQTRIGQGRKHASGTAGGTGAGPSGKGPTVRSKDQAGRGQSRESGDRTGEDPDPLGDGSGTGSKPGQPEAETRKWGSRRQRCRTTWDDVVGSGSKPDPVRRPLPSGRTVLTEPPTSEDAPELTRSGVRARKARL